MPGVNDSFIDGGFQNPAAFEKPGFWRLVGSGLPDEGRASAVEKPALDEKEKTVATKPEFSQPRRGARIKPGASAPGARCVRILRAPKGRHATSVAPTGLKNLGIGDPVLGLTPQALFCRPFGARGSIVPGFFAAV
jgi:hypothetical protein